MHVDLLLQPGPMVYDWRSANADLFFFRQDVYRAKVPHIHTQSHTHMIHTQGGGGGGLAHLPKNLFVYISVCTPRGGSKLITKVPILIAEII